MCSSRSAACWLSSVLCVHTWLMTSGIKSTQCERKFLLAKVFPVLQPPRFLWLNCKDKAKSVQLYLSKQETNIWRLPSHELWNFLFLSNKIFINQISDMGGDTLLFWSLQSKWDTTPPKKRESKLRHPVVFTSSPKKPMFCNFRGKICVPLQNFS